MCLNNLVPEKYRNSARKTGEFLADMEDVLIAAHVNLDGDALGALAACGVLLKKMGKKFALYSSTGVPAYLGFLKLPGLVYRSLRDLPFSPKNALYLDCSAPMRLGPELQECYGDWPSVNIDHHLIDRGFGSLYNFIYPDAAATSQLVAYVAEVLGQPLTGQIARSIALGLMTDTGGFCHGNTTADVFALCAKLARGGCDMSEIREKLQNSWTLDKLHLWGFAFDKVRVYADGKIAICAISLNDLEKYHCKKEDLEGLVEWLRKVRGVEIACLLREEDNNCKFSLRSYGDFDARTIAEGFGGGGHFNAAGGTIDSDIDNALAKLLESMRQYIYIRQKSH